MCLKSLRNEGVFQPLGAQDVLSIHDTAIERFGGLGGLLDVGLLESALAEPEALG